MPATSLAAHARAVALLLSLALAVGTSLVPSAPAHADLAASTAQPSDVAAQTGAARALQAMQEAYELLLDRYALPLDPAALTTPPVLRCVNDIVHRTSSKSNT